MTVATSVDASVIIESCHSPVATRSPRHTAEMIAALTPPIMNDSATITSATRNHGDSASRACSGLINAKVTKSLKPPVSAGSVSCTHSVTAEAPLRMLLPISTSDGNSAAHR